MARTALWLLTAIAISGAVPAGAADVSIIRPVPERLVVAPPAPLVVEVPPPAVHVVPAVRATPLLPPPRVRYGCQRVWRCDTQVCEWRRGCWGVYGYVETPYYTSAFAQRQWESHGLPPPPRRLRPRH